MICAADFRERVIQHAVVNICEPYFEKYQIFDSYACRKGKGVDACLERAKLFCRKYNWYLKLDIHKYFDSINHKILLNILDRRFKDPDLMNFFAALLDTYEVTPGCGLPIGNLLSQYFANMYLATLDHELKDKMKVAGYIRYMDDFVIFENNKDKLKQTETKVREFISNYLKLDLNLPQSNRTSHGIPFLSYLVKPDGLRLSLKAKQRFRKKFKIAERAQSADHALPLLAFISRANSTGFRKKLLYGT